MASLVVDGAAIALIVLVVALAVGLGSLAGGITMRRRQVARTGNDPADNPVNNGFNAWAGRHPLLAGVLIIGLFGIGVGFAILRATN